jgi:hypothetical protein
MMGPPDLSADGFILGPLIENLLGKSEGKTVYSVCSLDHDRKNPFNTG